jgi:chromosome segregation ATPase
MAKLTDADKLANKAAQKIRDKAYHQRQSQYRAAILTARDQIEATPEAKACIDTMAATNQCIAERDQAEAAIEEKIAALKDEMKAVGTKYSKLLDGFSDARREAWSVKNALEKSALADVAGDFADIAEVGYVGAWNIPAAVQEAMDKAAAEARAAYVSEIENTNSGDSGPT